MCSHQMFANGLNSLHGAGAPSLLRQQEDHLAACGGEPYGGLVAGGGADDPVPLCIELLEDRVQHLVVRLIVGFLLLVGVALLEFHLLYGLLALGDEERGGLDPGGDEAHGGKLRLGLCGAAREQKVQQQHGDDGGDQGAHGRLVLVVWTADGTSANKTHQRGRWRGAIPHPV
jgi:hypothetical protein